jgi:hypothetical protein
VTGDRSRRADLVRPAVLALAGVTVLALTGCAGVEPQAAQPGHPGVASGTGAMPTSQLVSTAQPITTGQVDIASPASAASHVDAASPAGPGGPASPASPPSAVSRPNPSVPASQPSCNNGSGFALSLVSDYHGWDSPVQAAQQFSRQANPAGYGTPSTVWTPSAPDSSGVTLTAANLSLHAVRLPNGRWAIDSGQRCD